MNKEESRKYHKKYREKNSEKIKNKYRARLASETPEQKERRMAYAKQYTQQHKEELIKKRAIYVKNNVEKIRSAARIHYKKNQKKIDSAHHFRNSVKNDDLKEVAINHRSNFTDKDIIEITSKNKDGEYNNTAEEVAIKIGRTLHSIKNARKRIKNYSNKYQRG